MHWARANITSNKNPVPFDSPKPSEWVGLRLGVAAASTRGLGAQEFEVLGNTIADLIEDCTRSNPQTLAQATQTVANLCEQFPIYPA